jgi:hypothetical protein
MSLDASKARVGDWFWHALIVCLVTLAVCFRFWLHSLFMPMTHQKQRRAAGIDVGSEQVFAAVAL